MSPYLALIDQVLALDDGLATSTYLSLYLPTATVGDRHLSTLIRGTLIDTFRSHPLTERYHNAHVRIANYFETLLQGQVNPKTLALFARFNLPHIEQATEHSYHTGMATTLLDLPIVIPTQSYLGKTFDLRPLFLLEENSVRALVVKLNNKGAYVFTVLNDQIEQIHQIDNIWADRGENENGPGLEIVLRRQDSGNHMVLNHLGEVLKTKLAEGNEWKQLVFFINNDFQSIIDHWLKNELHTITNIQPIVSFELPLDLPQIVNQTHNLIQAQQKAYIEELLELKNQEFTQWARGWKQVTDAVRNRQVDTLLISPGSGRQGYIAHESLPYVEKEQYTRPVRNLAPWLTKIVYQTNGKVVTSQYLEELINEPLARLRYVP